MGKKFTVATHSKVGKSQTLASRCIVVRNGSGITNSTLLVEVWSKKHNKVENN